VTTITELTFWYNRKKELFSNLSLDLPDGNIYGLLGKNGAGKTTLLKIMAGLLFPKQGESMINGISSGKRDPIVLQDIYFIPEEFYIPPVKPSKFIALYSGFYPEFDHAAMDQYIQEFELDPYEGLNTMSYGQKKKFLIAFGLASRCRILILDEPTNGLDIPSKSQFRKLTAEAMSDERTFIISTHQVRDMENLIDPIIIIEEGSILFYHDIAEITEKLALTVQTDEPAETEALYWEKVPGGYAVVSPNADGRESRIDLELLFNAAIKGGKKMKDIFEGAYHD
jgi:ABC-2 type transport system ATP-binding protein